MRQRQSVVWARSGTLDQRDVNHKREHGEAWVPAVKRKRGSMACLEARRLTNATSLHILKLAHSTGLLFSSPGLLKLAVDRQGWITSDHWQRWRRYHTFVPNTSKLGTPPRELLAPR